MATKSIHITTFGCQMNKADSELSLGLLLEKGYTMAEDETSADVILFNTCSVRQHAEDKVYSRLAQLRPRKTKNPGLIIGVLGCMAQKEAEKFFQRFPHVDLVCGTGMFDKVPQLLEKLGCKPSARGYEPFEGDCETLVRGKHLLAVEEDKIIDYPKRRAPRENPYQAFVTVMRGCDNYCSYCIVPYVRGRETSRSTEEIVKEIESLSEGCEPFARGCKEVTLLGQNINTYGKTLAGNKNLASLLRAVSQVKGIERIRFVTSHPKDMSIETLEAMAELPKVCNHLHMPTQSGSNRILDRMQRGYTVEHYLELISIARRLMPDLTISSDFIVGFPGETEEDFQDTVRLMESVRFQNSYIFKYSPRPGTTAASLPDDVPIEIKRERNQRLLKLQSCISLEENRKMIGQVVEVLVEGPSKSNKQRLSGRTVQNHIVVFVGADGLTGEIIKVRVEDATALTLFGEILL